MPLRHQVLLPLKCYTPQMCYPLKHFLLPYLVILESSCNNTISTLIMSLYASYVCLLHSRLVENPPIDLEETNPSFGFDLSLVRT
jgi:hypothetical protein